MSQDAIPKTTRGACNFFLHFPKTRLELAAFSVRRCGFLSDIPCGVLPVWPRRVNVGCGPAEERVLLTGLHAVADIYCENCKTTLGWKYVSWNSPSKTEKN